MPDAPRWFAPSHSPGRRRRSLARWSRRASAGSTLLGSLLILMAASAAAAPTDVVVDARSVKLTHGLTQYELTRPGACVQPKAAGGGVGCRAWACPLAVLVGGYAAPMVVWDETVPAIAATRHLVLRFDLYGRGRSARPKAEYTPDFFAQQLWELVNHLGLPCRFHVVASSMGGIVAAAFANRHPLAFNRVVLVSPAGLSEKFPPDVTLLKMPGVGWWYFRGWFREIMLDHLQKNVLADVRTYPTMLGEVRRQLDVPGSAEAMFSTLHATLLRDASERFRGFGGLRRPTRVLWGERDRLVPLRQARKALDATLPHAELCRVERAAHLPHVERPGAFNALVTQFLLSDLGYELPKGCRRGGEHGRDRGREP